MGMNLDAYLAYGYDLGTDEDPRFAETSEDGEITVPWFNDDAEDAYGDSLGFVEQLFNRLYTTIDNPPPADSDCRRQTIAEKHYGIEIEGSGGIEYPGHILIVKGSASSVKWSDAMVLDVAEMAARPTRDGWDSKLQAVIAALGVTPIQDGPKWLVFPSYV